MVAAGGELGYGLRVTEDCLKQNRTQKAGSKQVGFGFHLFPVKRQYGETVGLHQVCQQMIRRSRRANSLRLTTRNVMGHAVGRQERPDGSIALGTELGLRGFKMACVLSFRRGDGAVDVLGKEFGVSVVGYQRAHGASGSSLWGGCQ
jgi:hypothetical protein